MPSNLVINTESIVGYNNELQKADENMRFGVNVGVNEKSKAVGIKHNLGDSKVKLPHSAVKPPEVIPKKEESIPVKSTIRNSTPTESSHETNISVYMIAAVALGWYLFR